MSLLRRPSVGYVVEIDGSTVTLNVADEHRGLVAGHTDGVSPLGQPGDYLGADAGDVIIVLRITSLAYTEPKVAHTAGIGTPIVGTQPLRQMVCRTVGFIRRIDGKLSFAPQEWRLPALGAATFPLSDEEVRSLLAPQVGGLSIELGTDARSGTIPVTVSLRDLLSRHIAVLGSSGQGKTNFVASLLQKLLARIANPRIVIFDINGEYAGAFDHLPSGDVKITVIGSQERARTDYGGRAEFLSIPYYALGRSGLFRLLLPSERSQLPALRFALGHLQFVDTAGTEGAGLVGGQMVLFDDCRSTPSASLGHQALERLRARTGLTTATSWPHMRALSCVAADWYCIEPSTRSGSSHTRSGFLFNHVQSLINRIQGLIDDDRFRDVVQINGGPMVSAPGDLDAEASEFVEDTFGGSDKTDWKVHIVDLSSVAQDLSPFILGALLELFAAELFRQGPGKSHPTLLVLEEAHHYLRPISGDYDGTTGQTLAYERLAKEGRKFGVSLLVSTQRPSDLSPTVLAQCGTWAVFRLTNEHDQRAVSNALEHSSGHMLRALSGLPRGQALLFGASIPVPSIIDTPKASPETQSADAEFDKRWGLRDNIFG